MVYSKGELKIKQFLDKYHLNYIYQYQNKNCRFKNILTFDFAVFTDMSCKKLKCLIEYDGEQHYTAVDRFGGDEGLSYQLMRDDTKTKYCKDNNLLLVRIPYWDFKNVDNLLYQYLFENKKVDYNMHFKNLDYYKDRIKHEYDEFPEIDLNDIPQVEDDDYGLKNIDYEDFEEYLDCCNSIDEVNQLLSIKCNLDEDYQHYYPKDTEVANGQC